MESIIAFPNGVTIQYLPWLQFLQIFQISKAPKSILSQSSIYPGFNSYDGYQNAGTYSVVLSQSSIYPGFNSYTVIVTVSLNGETCHNPVSTLASILTVNCCKISLPTMMNCHNPVSTLASILTTLPWPWAVWCTTLSQSSIYPGFNSYWTPQRKWGDAVQQVTIQYLPWLQFLP